MDIQRLRALLPPGELREEFELLAATCDGSALAAASAQRFTERLFDQLPGGLAYLDTDLIFRKVNTLFMHLCPVEGTDVIGRPASEIFAGHHELAAVLATWQEVLCTGKPHVSYGFQFAHANGQKHQEKFWDVYACPMRDDSQAIIGVLDFCVDATPRVHLERDAVTSDHALARQQELNRSILDNIPAGIAYLDPNLAVKTINPALLQLVGRRREDIVGHPIFEVFPQLETRFQPILQRIFDGGEPISMREIPLTNLHGNAPRTDFWDFCLIPVRGKDGSTEGALVLGIDVSERVEKVRLQQEHQTRLKQIDTIKSDFLGTISHELRTPLSAILGFTYMLEDGMAGPLRAEQLALLAKVRAGGDTLLALVNELLDMASIVADRLILDSRPLRFFEEVDKALVTLSGFAQQTGHQIKIDVPHDLPLVHADEFRLAQILGHIVQNACKFTPPGGLIEIRARIMGDSICCEIEDHGIGIAPHDIPKIFQRFRQLDPSSTRTVGGMGVGLALAKFLVEAHGGTIGIDSTVGQGTTVRFTLPVAAEQGEAPPIPSSA